MDTYHEIRLEGRRRFKLAADGVEISANLAMGASYETLVKYEQMDPTITIIRQRHQLFWYSLLGVPLFALVTFVIVETSKFAHSDFLPGLFAGLALISVVVAVITRKQVEYARFCSTSGLPLLDIARAGPDLSKFDNYVAEIQARIETAQSATRQ